jgi:hypothetical protein
MLPQLLSGARGRIKYKDSSGNESTLAFVTDVTVQATDSLKPTYVVGRISPVTIEPLSYDVRCSIGRIVPVNKNDSAEALEKITSIDHRLEELINNILSSETVEIALEDQNPKNPAAPNTLAVIKHARFAGRSSNLASQDTGNERYEFVGIYDGGYGGDSNPTSDETGLAPINYNLE